MKILNEAKISFMSNSVNEGFARVAASGFFMMLDPTIEELADIKTAVSEAVTNAIVHGYRNTSGRVSMTLRILEGNLAYIRIRDNGCGIENVKQAMEPSFTTAPEEERAGLGFAVMQTFTDKLTVRSSLNKGTTVIMQKNLRSRDE